MAALGLICVTQTLSQKHEGAPGFGVHSSEVAGHGLHCLAAHGILVMRPGIEPASPALQGRFLTSGLTREVPVPQLNGIYSLIDGKNNLNEQLHDSLFAA